MAFLPPMAQQTRDLCVSVCACVCRCGCVCTLLMALMHCDRDEWSWTTRFQQQGVLRVVSRGSYLHKKATREETENMQVRGGKRGKKKDR